MFDLILAIVVGLLAACFSTYYFWEKYKKESKKIHQQLSQSEPPSLRNGQKCCVFSSCSQFPLSPDSTFYVFCLLLHHNEGHLPMDEEYPVLLDICEECAYWLLDTARFLWNLVPRKIFYSFCSRRTINILTWYFPNFRLIVLYFIKNKKSELHHKINIIELSPLGYFVEPL